MRHYEWQTALNDVEEKEEREELKAVLMKIYAKSLSSGVSVITIVQQGYAEWVNKIRNNSDIRTSFRQRGKTQENMILEKDSEGENTAFKIPKGTFIISDGDSHRLHCACPYITDQSLENIIKNWKRKGLDYRCKEYELNEALSSFKENIIDKKKNKKTKK